MNREESERATAAYLKRQLIRRLVVFSIFAIFSASIVIAYQPDEWNQFNHRSFKVMAVTDDGLLKLSTGDELKLLGVTSIDPRWLRLQTVGHQVTLLLSPPATWDILGHLGTFAYLDNVNLSVEAVKQGMARIDRREKTLFDGLLGPAEADARKKKRGIWGNPFSGGPEGRAPGPPGRR